MKDIYQLIRQRETEIAGLQKEMERLHREAEALRLAAKLLDDSGDSTTRPITPPASVIAREVPVYNAAPASRSSAPAPAAAPTVWAAPKQFP
jgi:hypothetical protein